VGKPTPSTLSPVAKTALRAVDPIVAGQLTKIATSAAYGAPATARASEKGASPPAAVSEARSLSTLGVIGSGDPLVILLVAVLGITTLGMIIAAAVGKTGRPRPRSDDG
jgi:hypothetical protein